MNSHRSFKLGNDLPGEAELVDALRMIAPGTVLRDGLENILRARTGALIVVGDSPELMKSVDGGFTINKEFAPTSLYELSKMDGAIIVSKDIRKIIFANVQLMPDASVPTEETGTRHRTAQRIARQTGELVLCVSQRRNTITLYKGRHKYILKDTASILAKANQALQTLEKYCSVLEGEMHAFSTLEFDELVTLDDVAGVILRHEMVLRVAYEVERYAAELGSEGRLVTLQMEELMSGVEEEELLIMEDYKLHMEELPTEVVLASIRTMTFEELTESWNIARALGYYGGITSVDINVIPRGYRMLSGIPRLPGHIVKKIVGKFHNLPEILKASVEMLDGVDGIGEVRARAIRQGLHRIRESYQIQENIR